MYTTCYNLFKTHLAPVPLAGGAGRSHLRFLLAFFEFLSSKHNLARVITAARTIPETLWQARYRENQYINQLISKIYFILLTSPHLQGWRSVGGSSSRCDRPCHTRHTAAVCLDPAWCHKSCSCTSGRWHLDYPYSPCTQGHWILLKEYRNCLTRQ